MMAFETKKETKGEQHLRKFLKSKLEELKPQGRNEVNQEVQNFQQKLLCQMMELDALFNAMFKEEKIQGSVQKSLKVGNPDEYDLDLRLRLLVDHEKIKVTESKEYPSWFYCSFPSDSWKWPLPRNKHRKAWRKLLKKDADRELCYLQGDALRNWLQGLVHRAIKGHEELRQVVEKETRSGPAITLFFKFGDLKLSMDLVAAIEIPKESWTHKFSEEFSAVDTSYFLIPVPPRVAKDSPAPPNNLLRGSFPELEAHLLEDQGCLKDVIRLLKLVRSNNSWSPIASFFITNICTNWCQMKSYNMDLVDSKLGPTFISFLEAMEQTMRVGKLPMTIFPECELLVKLKPTFCTNVANRLKSIIRKLEHCVKRQNKDHTNHILRLLFEPGAEYVNIDAEEKENVLEKQLEEVLTFGSVKKSNDESVKRKDAGSTKIFLDIDDSLDFEAMQDDLLFSSEDLYDEFDEDCLYEVEESEYLDLYDDYF